MHKNAPAVSVIVPVYNAEKHLGECINSILKQTEKDFELICVDDGSNDSSLQILHNFARVDKRIKVLTQLNAGVSAARNFGLEHASGQWIAFHDADDTCRPDMLSGMLGLATQDIGFVITHPAMRETLVRRGEVIDLIYVGMRTAALNPPWGKLYRRKILEQSGLRFIPSTSIGEDLLFNLEFLKETTAIATSANLRYLARETEGSLTRGYRATKYEDLMYVHDRLHCLLEGHQNLRIGSLLNYLRIKALVSSVNNLPDQPFAKKLSTMRAKARQYSRAQPPLVVAQGDPTMRLLGLSYNVLGLFFTSIAVRVGKRMGRIPLNPRMNYRARDRVTKKG